MRTETSERLFFFQKSRHHIILKMVLRTDSESSDFADLELAGVEPLTLEDIVIGESYVNTEMVRYVENSQLR